MSTAYLGVCDRSPSDGRYSMHDGTKPHPATFWCVGWEVPDLDAGSLFRGGGDSDD